MRKWISRRTTEDAGFTLIEVLVVGVVLSMVVATIMTILVSVLGDTRDLQQRDDAVDQARLAVAQIDRQVRSGNVLYDPASESLANSLRIYTQANGEQKCVQWQVYNGALRMRSWTTTWQTDGDVSAWRNVAFDVVNVSLGKTPFTLQGPTTAYNSRLLDIDLWTQVSSHGGSPVETTTSLAGRNTIYGYDTGVCQPVPNP